MRDDELEKIILHLQTVRDLAYEHYSKAVYSMMKNDNADKSEVEYLMDGLLDFCDEKRFVDIYIKLAKHFFYKYPKTVTSHVKLYLSYYEGDGNFESAENT